MGTEKGAAFWKAVARRGMQVVVSMLLMAAALFLSAGTLDFPRAWIFFGIYLASILVNTVVFLKFNPEVVAARSEIIRGKLEGWDKLFMIGYILFLLLTLVVCGLDARFGLSSPGEDSLLAGVIIFIPGWLLVMWAMLENKFFEGEVRVQKERGHKVISSGPYAFIRHPGYLGMILSYGCAPFILGSFYGLIPMLLLAATLVSRTHLEDKMLRKELDGYEEYAQRVKYRLVPGIW